MAMNEILFGRSDIMKVLHVIETLSPRYGGPVSVLKSLVRAQEEAGLDVTIYTTNIDFPKGIYCEPGERILDDLGRATVVFHRVDFQPLRYSRSLVLSIKSMVGSFDIIHIHGLYRFPPTYAAYQARKQGMPYIIMLHGSLSPYLFKRSTHGGVLLKRLYERLFDIPNLNHASALHFIADEERRRASFLGLKAPSFVIPNGLDWKSYEQLPQRGAFRARLGLGKGSLVLFLGRLHFVKGLDILVPAFAQVRHKYPDAKLAIVGPDNDNYGNQVKSWVRENGLKDCVSFVNMLDGTEVIQAYVDADVFALPSHYDCFPTTVIESLACKLPVVISDQVNIHREISESGGGLVTQCDVGEVAEAITLLLGDADKRRIMGEAGRRYVEEHYTWSTIVDSLTQEYESIITRVKNI